MRRLAAELRYSCLTLGPTGQSRDQIIVSLSDITVKNRKRRKKKKKKKKRRQHAAWSHMI